MEEFQFKLDYESIIHLKDIREFPKRMGLLYIFHANKIPPHIGWSEDDSFYSLKATGTDLGLDTNKINSLILQKEIPTLIVALTDVVINQKNVNNIFSSYGNGLKLGKTCLNPIDEVIFNQVRHDKIGDLLQSLNNNRIKMVHYGVNLPHSFQGILNYSKTDIEKRIIELQ